MTNRLHYKHYSIGRARHFRKYMTDAERKLWAALRGNQIGHYFRRQTPIGKYIVDFVCWKQKLIVEVDGSQHYSNEGIAYDKKRDEFLCTQGFRILRFNAVEVLSNTDGIVEVILDNIKNPLQSPYEGDS